MDASSHTLVLTGRPGSGKGTQAKLLASAHGWVHFSTGERFRALREGEGRIAALVREAYDSGKLIPDWFADYLFEEAALSLEEGQGIVLDGYPRTRAQAERFASVMQWLGRSYKALDLAVSEEEAMARMRARARIEHRPDSGTDEQVRARLATYDEHTAPVLAYFKEQGTLTVLDGMQTPEEVEAAIAAQL